jgi:hypothetical protein
MNRSSYSSANLRRFLWLWPALLVGTPLGCGKSSDDGDGVSTGGRGEAGSDSGEAGGSTASGASPSTGATSSGAASNGGSGIGGQAVGGAGPAGGTPNDSGGNGSGGASGGTIAGGSGGTGGTSGEHLYDLGDECTSPGVFGCSAANEVLALICGADSTWQVRETCEGGEKCDFRDGPGTGQCLAPVAGCETVTNEPICGETGIEVCKPGGFDTEVVEECQPGYGCVDAECVMVDDECPTGRPYECEGRAVCGGLEVDCSSSACEYGMSGLAAPADPLVVRIPKAPLCDGGCQRDPDELIFFAIASAGVGDAMKVTVGPGWAIYSVTLTAGIPVACEDSAHEGCIIVPRATSSSAAVALVPLTDPPVIRNLTLQGVTAETTCD